jgi:Binding-protein-dependent transport system inner membrane component/Bacterial extracellular solute-binding proteins, family 3
MVLMDAASSRGYVGANPDKLKVIGDPISSEDYGFIFPPKSDLVAPFNAAIETMKKDGYLDHLNTRWFISEIFRAGVESIGRGQMEAARSLGTSYWQAMRYIVLPQAIRNVLPPLGNDIIAMLKDSSWCPSWGTGHHSTRQGLLGQHVPRL